MEHSKVALKSLSYCSDVEIMKTIFSSGDFFPGFYRYTLGTQRIGEESLGLSTLIWLYLEQITTGRKHSKEDWLELQHEIHDREVASDKARNAGNFPKVRKMFSQKMMDWYFNSQGLDIIYQNVDLKVNLFKKETCYYFMGSLIFCSNDQLHIGYNSLTGNSSLVLNICFDEVSDYLNSIFNPEQIKDLFIYADTIAKLTFNKEDFGVLEMDDKKIDQYLQMGQDIKVFGSPIESRELPIRYAKTVRFTNFKRGDDGSFQVWKTDQNW